MDTFTPILTMPVPGVEVVTVRRPDGKYETTLNGGDLDGEVFVGKLPFRQHRGACDLVRGRAMATDQTAA